MIIIKSITDQYHDLDFMFRYHPDGISIEVIKEKGLTIARNHVVVTEELIEDLEENNIQVLLHDLAKKVIEKYDEKEIMRNR